MWKRPFGRSHWLEVMHWLFPHHVLWPSQACVDDGMEASCRPSKHRCSCTGKSYCLASSLLSEGISPRFGEYQLHLHSLSFSPSSLWQHTSTLPLAALRVLEALLLYLGALGVSNQRNSGHKCVSLCSERSSFRFPRTALPYSDPWVFTGVISPSCLFITESGGFFVFFLITQFFMEFERQQEDDVTACLGGHKRGPWREQRALLTSNLSPVSVHQQLLPFLINTFFVGYQLCTALLLICVF